MNHALSMTVGPFPSSAERSVRPVAPGSSQGTDPCWADFQVASPRCATLSYPLPSPQGLRERYSLKRESVDGPRLIALSLRVAEVTRPFGRICPGFKPTRFGKRSRAVSP